MNDKQELFQKLSAVFSDPNIRSITFTDTITNLALEFLVFHCLELLRNEGFDEKEIGKKEIHIRFILKTYRKISSVDFMTNPEYLFHFIIKDNVTCEKVE